MHKRRRMRDVGNTRQNHEEPDSAITSGLCLKCIMRFHVRYLPKRIYYHVGGILFFTWGLVTFWNELTGTEEKSRKSPELPYSPGWRKNGYDLCENAEKKKGVLWDAQGGASKYNLTNFEMK